MKAHEKKAIDRAMDMAFRRVTGKYKHDYPDDLRHEIAIEAVKIAQLRAGRFYDDETRQDAIQYALHS